MHYIAQEYVQGQNLRDYIARHGPPDLPHALSIMRQVAAALAKAAEQGVVHRDIKPENIMLTAGGEVKVADFGLARLTREGAANDLTQVGITLGTPLYMSPEQVEGKPLDPRSDIYSFGVTCYHMLAGAPPFARRDGAGRGRAASQEAAAAAGIAAAATCRRRCAGSSIRCWPRTRRSVSPRPATCSRELRRVQIEHFGDDWPEDLPAWESLAAEQPLDPRAAVTQAARRADEDDGRVRPGRLRGVGLAAGCWWRACVGGGVAWFTVVPPSAVGRRQVRPAADPQAAHASWRQWYLASQIGTEAAWQSVIDYFPEKPYVATGPSSNWP